MSRGCSEQRGTIDCAGTLAFEPRQPLSNTVRSITAFDRSTTIRGQMCAAMHKPLPYSPAISGPAAPFSAASLQSSVDDIEALQEANSVPTPKTPNTQTSVFGDPCRCLIRSKMVTRSSAPLTHDFLLDFFEGAFLQCEGWLLIF